MSAAAPDTYYLLPGGLFANQRPHIVDTILGSCVALCLYDDKLKIGGINHYMLPLWNGEGLASPKYGNIAVERLVEKMMQMGSSPRQLVAKVFGGANQMNSSLGVGERNILLVREMLKEYHIPIVAENVGGYIGRKIRFDTSNGQVLMKFLQKTTT